jgi:hypothetical protein
MDNCIFTFTLIVRTWLPRVYRTIVFILCDEYKSKPKNKLNTKLRGSGPRANYTDQIEGVAWSAQRIPTVVNLGFLDQSRYFSFK